MQTYGTNMVHENWEYQINHNHIIILDFENGILTNVSQY